MTPLLYDLSKHPELAQRLCLGLHCEQGELESRHFPDGELYQRVHDSVDGRSVIVFTDLFHPDPQLFTLLSLGHTLQELGAREVCLVTAYLPYMRQDKRFNEGESITSVHFARHLSLAFTHLVTVDPHLHRYHSLDDIYTLRGLVVTAEPVIVDYLKGLNRKLLLIGPDEESEQWVRAIAEQAALPFQILTKERRGDYDVSVSEPKLDAYRAHQPVLIDDIISSGRTMISTLDQLDQAGMGKALIIGVHGIFARDAYALLVSRAEVITCNSIPHSSNQIDLSEALIGAISDHLSLD